MNIVATVNKLNKQIDYNKTKLEDRKKIVENILSTGFYEEYMDNYFNVHLNADDELSEKDYVCNSLERLANYLLNSDEVKEEKKSEKFEYKFYADEEAFNKAVNKEPKLDGMANTNGFEVEKENVIHFLKRGNRNYKMSKTQTITKKDLRRDDELGRILREYTDYLEKISQELNDLENSKLSRFQLSRISGAIKKDMILVKDILLGVFGYKTNSEESTKIDWDQIDFTNHSHVRALLYMRPGSRADIDLKFIIDDFIKLVEKAKPTKLQRQIIKLLRENKRITDIGEELNITKQRVNKNIDVLVKRICKIAKQA
jgi:hypothetical protein